MSASQSPVTTKIALSAILVALGVVLSLVLNFPVPPTKCYPGQHMINAIAGVLVGPWYGALIALLVGAIRMASGTGTIFAFPGGIPGALIVGLVYWYLRKTDYAAFAEPLGTAVGGVISATVFVPIAGPMRPFWGLTAQWTLFTVAFLISSVPGCVMGFLVIKFLRRSGIADRIFHPETSR